MTDFLTCRECGLPKAEAEFGLDRTRPSGRHPYCRTCRRVREKIRYANSPEHREGARWRQIKFNYGMTKEEWMALYEKQGGCCAICLRPLDLTAKGVGRSATQPVVDHCHVTGQNRGILCHDCNLGIGYLSEDLATLQRAIAYLSR